MARHDNRNRIAPVRQSHGAYGFGVSDAPRELRVRNRLSVGNRTQLIPHAKLKLRSLHRQRHIEFLQFSSEVGLQLSDDFGKWRTIQLPARLRRSGMLSAFETHAPQRLRIARQKQRPNRTFESGVVNCAHFFALRKLSPPSLAPSLLRCLIASPLLFQSPPQRTDSQRGISSRTLRACTSFSYP